MCPWFYIVVSTSNTDTLSFVQRIEHYLLVHRKSSPYKIIYNRVWSHCYDMVCGYFSLRDHNPGSVPIKRFGVSTKVTRRFKLFITISWDTGPNVSFMIQVPWLYFFYLYKSYFLSLLSFQILLYVHRGNTNFWHKHRYTYMDGYMPYVYEGLNKVHNWLSVDSINWFTNRACSTSYLQLIIKVYMDSNRDTLDIPKSSPITWEDSRTTSTVIGWLFSYKRSEELLG